uniref:RING-type E3 ubiquitin transferase n=1 Tax=Panagrellus redivivus TaxID=6233 RepID=A0A7E4W0W5_PANRE
MASLYETFHQVALLTFFKKLAVQGQALRSQNHLHPTLYKISQDLPNLSQAFIDFVKALTVALFYLFKTPYHDVSKAFTDIQYRSIRPQSNFQTDKLYKFIGLASLCRLAFVVKQKFEHYSNTDEGDFEDDAIPEEEVSDTGARNTFDCQLCCDNTKPVSTPCGHVFCWSCIERSKVADGGAVQCPSCRFQFAHGRSIPLMNL